jgi:hypothetical protein
MSPRAVFPALCAGLFLSVAASATSVDVYAEYVKARSSMPSGSADDRFPDTASFLGEFLKDPSSPYSPLAKKPASIRAPWWNDFARRIVPGTPDARDLALGRLQRFMGLTKARPGIEIAGAEEKAAAFNGREAAASAIKASVDADIFWKARDLNGTISAAAAHAVAMQLLRDAMRDSPQDSWEAQGLKADVLQRMLTTDSPDFVSEEDDRYLGDLLAYAIQTRQASSPGVQAVYRVARVAAAYTDAQGYFGEGGFCQNDEPRTDQPTDATALDDHRPLCFIAATDRGVHAWFRGQLRLDTSGARIHENSHNGFERVAYWLGAVLPVVDLVAFVELANAAVADELVEAEAVEASEAEDIRGRAERLACGVRAS